MKEAEKMQKQTCAIKMHIYGSICDQLHAEVIRNAHEMTIPISLQRFAIQVSLQTQEQIIRS